MKKYLSVALFLLLTAVMLAEPIKVALGSLDKKDRDSDYIVSALLKRDLKALFDGNENYDLMDIKKTDKAISKASEKAFIYLNKEEKLEVGRKIEADVVMWGDVTSINGSMFKLSLNMLAVQNGDFKGVTFELSKNSKDRMKVMDENIFCTLDDACESDTGILLDIAMQQYALQDYEQAEQTFQAVLGNEPQNLQALYYLGAINYINKKYEESLSFYQAGHELATDNKDFLNQMSLVLQRLDRIDEAIEALQQVLLIEDNADIWMRIAALYQNLEYYEEAEEAYISAISLNDSLNYAYLELGILFYEQEYYEESLPYLEEAVKRFPEDDLLNKKLARAYQRTGKIENAIRQYNDLIAANPENLKAYYNLANAYITINNFEAALETAKKIQQKDAASVNVQIILANSYSALKKFADAEKAALKALELDRENYQAFRVLSEIYQELGYLNYEKYLVYEEEAKTLYGKDADDKIEQRDQTKEAAHQQFLKSQQYLDEAAARTTISGELRYIKQRKESLKQLLDATKKSFF